MSILPEAVQTMLSFLCFFLISFRGELIGSYQRCPKDKKIIGCSLQGIHENFLRHEHGRLKKVLGDGSTGLNIDVGTPERLIFLEAPIDLMSYYELNKNRLENVRLVSMDGLKDTTISRHVKNNIFISHNSSPLLKQQCTG